MSVYLFMEFECDDDKARQNISTPTLDADVLAYFQATRRTAKCCAPYQTQINNELSKILENGLAETAKSRRMFER